MICELCFNNVVTNKITKGILQEYKIGKHQSFQVLKNIKLIYCISDLGININMKEAKWRAQRKTQYEQKYMMNVFEISEHDE